MNEKKKKNNIGFYTVFCCCIAALGIVGFVNANRSQKNNKTTSLHPKYEETSTIPPIIITEEEAPVNAKKVIEITETPTPVIRETATPAPTPEPDIIEAGENQDFYTGPVIESVSIKNTPEFVFPTNGIISREFSGDTLYYDEKMDDYRTHNGIDISAQADSDVIAAGDGIIEECYEDTNGKTVVINHENGYKTLYSNLDDISNIKDGMNINQGDFLAHVGKNPEDETNTESYIYFEIIKDGESVNPEDYFE